MAVKNIKIEHCDEGLPSTALREMSLLMEIDHPSIVKLKEIHHGKDKLFLVFEYFNTDLKHYIERRGYPLHMSQIKEIL